MNAYINGQMSLLGVAIIVICLILFGLFYRSVRDDPPGMARQMSSAYMVISMALAAGAMLGLLLVVSGLLGNPW